MIHLPQDSKSLIAALDEQEQPRLSRVEDILTEEARLNLARQLGRRELVNELLALLKREAASQ